MCKKFLKLLIIAVVFAASSFAQISLDKFDEGKMRERVKALSADEFEGRGPGTEGGRKAANYIADQMKASGVRPANGKSFFQNVKLIGLKAQPETELLIEGENGPASYKFGDDFVATTGAQGANVSVDSEIVFMGYGIDAPLYKWNDYAGPAEDYRGKVLMIMVNDPPATDAEPNLFGGRALTYFGRWVYKYEEAARRGAAGVILIHTNESAGYGWNVVRTSNGGWRYEVARTPQDTSPFLKIRAWATNDAAGRMLKSVGMDIDELRKKASIRGFKPVNTGLKVKVDLSSELQTFDSPNVIGIVEGSDKRLKNEYVIYSAHWDHLGIGEPGAGGDKIYNGAYDNASGVATVLGIADVLAKMPQRNRPKRSFLFFFPTAEEQGLLGAEYYSRHPLFPLSKTAANINIDGVNFFGKVSDFIPLGYDRSSLADVVNEAAVERKLTVIGDERPEQGFFFRSDHFPFAKAGVPAISLQHGTRFTKPLSREAEAFGRDYTAKHYHQVTDEYHDWWDMSAMAQEAELALGIGVKIANLKAMPSYNVDDEFSVPDKKRFK